MPNKTHWKKLQNPNYLGSYEFQPDQDMTLTIKHVRKEFVTGDGGRKDEKAVMHFMEPVKPMILNTVNSKTLTRLFRTPYLEDWAGRKITLYADPTIKYGNEVTGGIRVRDKLPASDVPCEECGVIIVSSGKHTAQSIVERTKQKFGRALCMDCARTEGAKNEQTDEKPATEGDG